MKNIFKVLICLIILTGINTQSYSQIDKAMTYNIRYDNHNDGVDQWDNRKAEVVELIRYYAPDVFGIQEGLVHQLNYMDDHLSNYKRIGVGRDDGKEKGEFSPIYYDSEKLLLIKGSTFWLSENDSEISVGWDASMERICTYGLFENRVSKERILVFNTHYDHIGKVAREQSSELILMKIKEINTEDYPVVLMGDFNSEPENNPIKIIVEEMEDAAILAIDGIYGPTGTFTGFEKGIIAERRIDYVFVKGLKVLNYRHIDDKRRNGNYISDHLPVLVELR